MYFIFLVPVLRVYFSSIPPKLKLPVPPDDIMKREVYPFEKLSTTEFTIRYQPSTSTNKRILNGRDIMMGGSISIPIDIKILETIISIIRKGM